MKNQIIVQNASLLEENSMIERLKRDDEEAFGLLYIRYKPKVIFFCLRFVYSRELAEDVFQEVFSTIWQMRHHLDVNRNFSNYVYTLTKNKIINLLREINQHTLLKERLMDVMMKETTDLADDYAFHELSEYLQNALSELSPRQQEIFFLSREENLSHKEIASQLGISQNTVQTHIYVTLKKIRTYLLKKGFVKATSLNCDKVNDS